MWTGPYAGFFHLGLYAEKVPNIQRIINNHLKIVNIVFSGGWVAVSPFPLLCTALCVETFNALHFVV